MAIVLQESLRGLFYAPYYAALALGAYDQEGIEVKFVSAPSPGHAADGLFHGTVDVTWGGPMRVNQIYDQRAHCDFLYQLEWQEMLENGALTLRDLKTLQGSARGDKNGHSRGGKRA